jgi:hypothetical protein
MRTPLAVLLVAGLLTACDAPHTGPTATPTVAAAPVVEVMGDAPAFDPAAATGYAFMLPGAGLVVGGAAHAWVVGFGEERGDQEVMRLVSADVGSSWEVADRRVGRSMGLAFDPPGAIPSSVLAPEDGGEWVMYFAASLEGGDDGSDIWRATAPGPEGPWTPDPEPVLARVDLPTEDGGTPTQIDFPAVVRTDDGYRMLFGWSPSRATTLIRSATSADGVSWTVADAPAIDVGLCGGFDTRSVAMPRVAAHPDGGWIALYGGFGDETDASMAVGLARSTDGAAWTCAATAPILEVGDIPGSERIHSYALLAEAGEAPRLLIESLAGNRSDLWLAELSLSPQTATAE